MANPSHLLQVYRLALSLNEAIQAKGVSYSTIERVTSPMELIRAPQVWEMFKLLGCRVEQDRAYKATLPRSWTQVMAEVSGKAGPTPPTLALPKLTLGTSPLEVVIYSGREAELIPDPDAITDADLAHLNNDPFQAQTENDPEADPEGPSLED